MSVKCPRVVVLCYHSVHPKKFFSVPPNVFERHLIWLKKHCDPVPFTGVADLASRCDTLQRHAVAITFDDGYRDNFDFAFPLLRKHGVPATFFVTIGFLERDPSVMEIFRVLRRARDDELQPLMWAQVREMRRAGMEFGTHTYSHRNLARMSSTAVEAEGTRSKLILEDRLGERITTMAYPFGAWGRHFTGSTMAIMSRIRYEYAASTVFRAVRPTDSPLAIPRFFAGDGIDLTTLRDKVSGAWDMLGYVREKMPWVVRGSGGDS